MDSGVVNLNGVSLKAPRTWTFYPFDDLILARRDSGVGSLQISLAYRNELSLEATHADCLELARQFTASAELPEFETSDQAGCLFGSGTVSTSGTLSRVWYRFKFGQLLVAIYSCRSSQQDETELNEELLDCELIASTMEFHPG